MKQIIQKFILFLVCVASGSSLFPFIFSYDYLKKGDQELFILGDLHANGAIDVVERDMMLAHLMNQDYFDESIAFVIEGNKEYCDYAIEMYKKQTKKAKFQAVVEESNNLKKNRRVIMLETLRCLSYVDTKYFLGENLEFVYADCRNKILMKLATSEMYNTFETYNTFSSARDCTDFVSVMQPTINKALKFFKKYAEDSNAESSLQACVDFLEGDQKHKDCTDFLLKLTDINFYIDTLQSFEKHEKVILYAGARHCKVVKEMFENIGFVEIESQGYTDQDLVNNVHVLGMFFGGVAQIKNDFFKTSLLTASRMESMFGFSLDDTEIHSEVKKMGFYSHETGFFSKKIIAGGVLLLYVGGCALRKYCMENECFDFNLGFML